MTTKATSIDTRAVPVGFLHTLLVALVFTPSALVAFLVAGTPAVVLFYSQAALTLLVLLAGLLFAGATTSLLALGVALAGLFHYDRMGWKRVTFLAMLWSVSAVTIFSVATGNPWVAVITGFVSVANWWLVQGSLLSRFAKGGRNGAQLQTDLAAALLDYFAPSGDFRVKPKEGDAYVDEKARMTKALSHITKVEQVEPDVFRVDIRNNVPGKTDEKLMTELKSVSANLGFHDWESVDEDPRDGFVTITIWKTDRSDPTDQVRPYRIWDENGKLVKTTPKSLRFGTDSFGRPVTTPLYEGFLFVVGKQGSGKSVTERVVTARMAELPNVAIIGLDPKRVELTVWKDRASLIVPDRCCFPYVADAIWEEIESRSVELEDAGKQKITPESWNQYPALAIIGDELREIFVDWDNPKNAGEKSYLYFQFQRFVAFGRFVGVSMLTATQRAKNDLIPTNYRELQSTNVVHKVKTESDTKMAMGDVDPMPPAHLLKNSQNGVGYFADGDGEPSKFRTDWLMTNDDRERILKNEENEDPLFVDIARNYPTVEEIVESTKHLRVELDFLQRDTALQEHLEEHRIAKERKRRELARRNGSAT